jgi:hypothetical protein
VRTKRWKFIQYADLQGMDELYDLEADPYEMHNRIADARVRAELEDRLQRLLRETQ